MTNPTPPDKTDSLRDRLVLALVLALRVLPLGLRVRVAGWIGQHLIAPLTPLPRKIAAAIRHFLPDLPDADVRRIARRVPGNLARMVVEVLSARDLATLAATLPIEGPGLVALDDARIQRRPVILVSAHFGNYDAWRLALIARGLPVGGYFKELGSPALNRHYLAAVHASGQPMFPDTGEGRKAMIRFLRQGGMLGILMDLDRPHGVMLDFLGQPTRTVLSMADMALKYDALLVPIYGIRTPEKPGFRVVVEAPIPASDARTMTQALNDSFGARVRQYPEQWVWWHNRRKKSHPAA